MTRRNAARVDFPVGGILFYLSLYALRLLLIVGNALLFTWMACIFPTDHAIANTSDYVFGFGVLICSGLNLIYLLWSLVPVLTRPSAARHITAEW